MSYHHGKKGSKHLYLFEETNVMEQLRPFAISSRLSEETDAMEQHVSNESLRAPIGYQFLHFSPVP